MMNRARLLIYLLLLSFNVGAQDLDAILELNAAAHGGADNFKRIENVRFQLTISEPGFEVSGTYVATRHGSMRIDIEADGQRVFSEGLHQGQAWQWKPGSGFEDQDGEAAAALRHGIDSPGRFFTMNQVRERGATITLEGAVPEGDPQQWQLRIVLPDGFSRDYFIDQESGRTVRERDYRAFHPALDATRETVETRFDGELWMDGVLRFTRSENINADTGDWLGTTSVRSVEHNIDIAEGHFQPRAAPPGWPRRQASKLPVDGLE
jgi:hypothetical protein